MDSIMYGGIPRDPTGSPSEYQERVAMLEEIVGALQRAKFRVPSGAYDRAENEHAASLARMGANLDLVRAIETGTIAEARTAALAQKKLIALAVEFSSAPYQGAPIGAAHAAAEVEELDESKRRLTAAGHGDTAAFLGVSREADARKVWEAEQEAKKHAAAGAPEPVPSRPLTTTAPARYGSRKKRYGFPGSGGK